MVGCSRVAYRQRYGVASHCISHTATPPLSNTYLFDTRDKYTPGTEAPDWLDVHAPKAALRYGSVKELHINLQSRDKALTGNDGFQVSKIPPCI